MTAAEKAQRVFPDSARCQTLFLSGAKLAMRGWKTNMAALSLAEWMGYTWIKGATNDPRPESA